MAQFESIAELKAKVASAQTAFDESKKAKVPVTKVEFDRNVKAGNELKRWKTALAAAEELAAKEAVDSGVEEANERKN